MFKLKFFKKSDSICGSDFENKDRTVLLNEAHIESISDLMDFNLPFSGKHVGKYAYVIMSSGDTYFIKENSYQDLLTYIHK